MPHAACCRVYVHITIDMLLISHSAGTLSPFSMLFFENQDFTRILECLCYLTCFGFEVTRLPDHTPSTRQLGTRALSCA